MYSFIQSVGKRKWVRGESRAFEFLVTHTWQRQMGPQYIGSSPRALAGWQLPMLLRARSS